MTMIKGLRLISVGILLLVSRQLLAGWFGADFAADIYEGTAQNPVHQGNMSVSQGRVRTEINRNGKTMIEIIDPGRGKAWLLNPQVRQYLEREVPKRLASSAAQPTPCDGVPPQAICRKLGSEPVNGRGSEKWQLGDGEHTQLVWLDSAHHFPVKVVNDGKLAMEMRFLGADKVNGRAVEKWNSQMQTPQGVMSVTQWYDPQLNIAIRRLMPDGTLQELRNIRIGRQADSLFRIPEGYQRIAPGNTQ